MTKHIGLKTYVNDSLWVLPCDHGNRSFNFAAPDSRMIIHMDGPLFVLNYFKHMLLMLIGADILDIDTVLMLALLIRDTVIVDLSNVRVYFIQICMYILHKAGAVGGEQP